MAQAIIPVLRSPRQENHHKFKASLDYRISLKILFVCLLMGGGSYSAHMEVRGQPVGISSLHAAGSGYQTHVIRPDGH